MRTLKRLDARVVSLLVCALGFAVAVSILFANVFGQVPSGVNVAQLIVWIPIGGMLLVGALTWLVVFPKWQENHRVQKVITSVTGVGQAEREVERRTNHTLRKRLKKQWVLGMAAAGAVIFLLRSGVSAPLWTPVAIITVLAQLNVKQTLEERIRSLAICGALLLTFGDLGRNWLSSLQGSILLGSSLFGMVGWHFWQQKRGVAEMQRMVREARYLQAITKAELSPSPVAPALKAYAQFRQGLTARAKDGLRQALAKTIDSAKASFALAKYGEILVAEGQYEEARRPVTAALELNPNEARAHRVMAQTWLEAARVNRIKTGTEQTERSERSAQSDLQALSAQQPGAQNFAEALAHARKAVELVPDRSAELAVLAWALAASGNEEEARNAAARASEAIIDQLDLAEGRFFLGCAYQAMDSQDECRACFEAVKGAEARGYYHERAEQALAEMNGAQKPSAAFQPELG
jgi:tetratricopeptide (TPR) repeat protein